MFPRRALASLPPALIPSPTSSIHFLTRVRRIPLLTRRCRPRHHSLLPCQGLRCFDLNLAYSAPPDVFPGGVKGIDEDPFDWPIFFLKYGLCGAFCLRAS